MHTRYKLIATLMLVTAQLAFAGDGAYGDKVNITLAFYESILAQKQVCAEKYPEFSAQNDAAFRASIYSKATGEEIINAMASNVQKPLLLQMLPNLRSDSRKQFLSLDPDALKDICAKFADQVTDLSKNGVYKKP
jgi:hypothetical protein